MPIYQLDNRLWFPDPRGGNEKGLIAVGGDLSYKRLLLAYSHGIFPWFSFRAREEAQWYCPMNRFVIFPKEIHVSHSMKQMLKQKKYSVTFNQDFDGVIHGCAEVNGRINEYGAWLGKDIIEAYTELHEDGYVASVEVWENPDPASENLDPASENQKPRLVGGLYGVAVRNVFVGESMFSLVPSASKLALIHLARKLEEKEGTLIDCQFETPHLKSMGGRFIPYDQYMEIMNSDM